MAIRLRDVNPVIFLNNLSIGHSNQPNGSLDVQHDTDESRVFASFLNPSAVTDNVKSIILLGKSTSDDEMVELSYVHNTASLGQEFTIAHKGDTVGINLRNGGNVGIGIVRSSHKLHVAGTVMVDNKVVGQSTILQLDTETAGGGIQFLLAGAQKMKLDANGLGVGIDPTSSEKLKVNGKLNVLDAIQVSGTEIVGSDKKIAWGILKSVPSWIDSTQSAISLSGFGGSIGWSKVGLTGDVKPTWLVALQANVNLSGFNNDLGASSQWTDKTNTYGSASYEGIYYTNSDAKKAKVTIGDDDIHPQRLYVRDDTTWQLRLRNAATGGSDWHWGVNATNVLRGTGGKLLLSPSSNAALTKFTFTTGGAFWINEDPAGTEAEKLVVNGSSLVKGNSYLKNASDQLIIINKNFSSGGKNADDWETWWYNYAYGTSSSDLKWYRNGDLMCLKTDGGLGVNKGSVTATYKLDVNGTAKSTGWVTSSDENKKEDIVESDLGLEFIKKLNPVKYKWRNYEETIPLKQGEERIESHSFTRVHYGFTAQQVKQAITDLGLDDFGGYKDSSVSEPDKPAEYSLDYTQLISPLVKAIQELTAKVEALENA